MTQPSSVARAQRYPLAYHKGKEHITACNHHRVLSFPFLNLPPFALCLLPTPLLCRESSAFAKLEPFPCVLPATCRSGERHSQPDGLARNAQETFTRRSYLCAPSTDPCNDNSLFITISRHGGPRT